MTLATWKKEFYPVPATKRMSKRAAIEHSIRKWEGLLKSNLKKHGAIADYEYGWIAAEDRMNINEESCALCVKFLEGYSDSFNQCRLCPLFKTLDAPCDYYETSPYRIWRDTGNPRPMIKALKKTLANLDV